MSPQTKTWPISSEAELVPLAEELALRLAPGGMTVGFNGPLGAGKTALIRVLVAALGSGEPVSSPSYVLEHRYETKTGLIIAHWDLYRLESLPEELCEPCPPGELRLVEWAERCSGLICDQLIEIAIIGEQQRSVTVLSRNL